MVLALGDYRSISGDMRMSPQEILRLHAWNKFHNAFGGTYAASLTGRLRTVNS